MKKIALNSVIALMLFFLLIPGKTITACNADFNYSNACAGDTVWFSPVWGGPCTWDFGDTLSSVNCSHFINPYHVYTTPGTYTVSFFVDDGFQWDFRIKTITIGTNCFHASFSSTCMGGNAMNFSNESIGSTSASWDFGDNSSGSSNTSTLINPQHTFTSPGSYVVTLISSNGVVADTAVQTVLVSANCIGATINNLAMGDHCYNDTTVFYVTYSGTITSYLWNFADPASGVNNTSTNANPTHLFSAIGTYNVMLVISNGFANDTITSMYTLTDCTCWPGDCNNDGEVNCDDIFPIGIFYSHTGPPRTNASINFTSQPAQNWDVGPAMFLQTMVDTKCANTNGDGVINNLDVAAISTNYGLRHNNQNNVTSMPQANQYSPTMYIQFSSGTATAGSTVTATIYLGTQAIPVNYMYGYSFSVLYDAAMVVPGSAVINTSANWLGDASNEFSVSHDNYAGGRIEAGVVRYNSVEVLNGYGAIGTVTFQLQNNATGTFHLSLASSAKVLSIDTYYTVSAGGIELFVPVNLAGDNLSVQNPVGVSTYANDNSVQVFPNPATDIINVMLNNAEVSEIKLMNSLGQVVYTNAGHFTNSIKINTFDFAKGIYTLSCITKDGIVVKKINVIK